MAIYEPKVGEGVIPNLPTKSGFNVDSMTFGSLDSAIKSQVKKMNQEAENVDKSITLLTDLQDKATNFRIDNPNQQSVVEEAKKAAGVDNVFNTATLESLKSPYGAKLVESAYAKFVADPKIAQVVMEQSYADKYQKDLAKINDAKLREMALTDYQKYRNGEITGDALVADDYMEVDIPKILGTDFKAMAPKVEEHMRRNNIFGANYVESMKTRDSKAMELVFENRLSDPKFVNNLVAKGFYDKENQSLTEEGQKFVDALLHQYQVEEIKMKNVRHDKQVNKYESNINKTSTFTGTYTGTSTSTKIGSDGSVMVGGVPASLTKGAKSAVDIMQQQVGQYGINANQYAADLQDPKKLPSTDAMVYKAVRDPNRNAFAMLAATSDNRKLGKELAQDLLNIDQFGRGPDVNAIFNKYAYKGKGKRDTKLRDALSRLSIDEQQKFVAEAILDAQELASQHKWNLSKSTSKNTTSTKTTKTRKASVKNVGVARID